MPLHVRTGDIAELQVQAPAGGAWLSPTERARLAGIVAARRAAQFVAGRWLARRLLAEAYGGSPTSWQLEGLEGEVPTVAGHPAIHLSIAHSAGLAVCATGDVPLGVDVEASAARIRAGLLEAITTPPELAEMGDVQDGTLTQQVWTLKEAWIKCSGAELFSAMLGHGVRARPAPPGTGNACTWHQHGAVFALAVQGSLPRVCCGDGKTLSMRHWQVSAGI